LSCLLVRAESRATAEPSPPRVFLLGVLTFLLGALCLLVLCLGTRTARGLRFFAGAASSGAEAKGRPQDRAHVGHHQPRALFQVLGRPINLGCCRPCHVASHAQTSWLCCHLGGIVWKEAMLVPALSCAVSKSLPSRVSATE